MDTSVAFVLLAALAVTSGAAASKWPVVIDVCQTLKQDHDDIVMCCDKARGRNIEIGEKAIITYLCCLGYFGEVKYQYMDKITFNLLIHIIKTFDENESRLQAIFIVKCQDATKAPLSETNYIDWKSSGRNPEFCRKKA